jgi:hypothetical protein
LHSIASDVHRPDALQAFVCYYNTERLHLGQRGLTPTQRLAREPVLLPTS